MQRLAIISGLLVGLIVAAIGALGATRDASALQAGYLQYKCYRPQVVESSTRELKQTYIRDQFEEKNLLIRAPLSYCALATNDTGPTGELLCYAIKDAPGQPRFRQQDVVSDDGYNTLHLKLTKAYSLCEPSKQFTNTGGVSEQNAIFPRVKCYKVRQGEHSSGTGKTEIVVQDKFDTKEIRIGRPTVFCTEVEEKKGNAKNDDVDEATYISSVPFEDHTSTLTAKHPRTDPPSECGRYEHSVWYSYTPGEKVDAYISTQDSTYPTLIGVYTGSGKGDLEELDCENQAVPGLEVDMKPGVKYWILIGSVPDRGAGKLKFSFDVESSCASDCADPEPDPDAVSAGGIQTPEPQPPQPDPIAFNCYTISQRSPDAEIEVQNQFGAYLLDLGRGNMFCSEAEKCTIVPVGTEFGAIGEASGCYD